MHAEKSRVKIKIVSKLNKLYFELTASQVTGVCRVTGSGLTVPRPSASRFLCWENRRSSFFSSSDKLLQYLEQKSSSLKSSIGPGYREKYFFLSLRLKLGLWLIGVVKEWETSKTTGAKSS